MPLMYRHEPFLDLLLPGTRGDVFVAARELAKEVIELLALEEVARDELLDWIETDRSNMKC